MLTQKYLDDVLDRFRELKKLADGAIAQLSRKDDLFQTLDPETNSIAVTMKHIAGNMRSRWTNFLTTDGEKADRNRDSEFVVADGEDFERLQQVWESAWECLFDAIRGLTPDDLEKTVKIRNEPHYVFQAINRQLLHYGYHVGQIVFVARHLSSDHWKSLSVPRGQSNDFNRRHGL